MAALLSGICFGLIFVQWEEVAAHRFFLQYMQTPGNHFVLLHSTLWLMMIKKVWKSVNIRINKKNPKRAKHKEPILTRAACISAAGVRAQFSRHWQAAEASLERLVSQMLSVVADLKRERLETFLKQIRMRGYDEGVSRVRGCVFLNLTLCLLSAPAFLRAFICLFQTFLWPEYVQSHNREALERPESALLWP